MTCVSKIPPGHGREFEGLCGWIFISPHRVRNQGVNSCGASIIFTGPWRNAVMGPGHDTVRQSLAMETTTDNGRNRHLQVSSHSILKLTTRADSLPVNKHTQCLGRTTIFRTPSNGHSQNTCTRTRSEQTACGRIAQLSKTTRGSPTADSTCSLSYKKGAKKTR